MKKMTKMGIDALRENLPVLSQEEQRGCMGMYSGDSFWRCVSYLKTGDITEAGAEPYALDWGAKTFCGDYDVDYAHNYLTQNGATIGFVAAQNYLNADHPDLLNRIAMDSRDQSCLVILGPHSSMRDYDAFDPVTNSYSVISREEFYYMSFIY